MTLLEEILIEECEKKEVDIDLVNKIIEYQITYEGKSSKETLNRKKIIQKLIKESIT